MNNGAAWLLPLGKHAAASMTAARSNVDRMAGGMGGLLPGSCVRARARAQCMCQRRRVVIKALDHHTKGDGGRRKGSGRGRDMQLMLLMNILKLKRESKGGA